MKAPRRKIGASEHRRMPWRNGGGTTTEILVEPPAAASGTSPFRIRLSIADVASDGPFSVFAGYDRHIVLLEGAGMTIDCGAHGLIDLRRREPRSFAGDWEVRGRLVAGPVRDLNLMVDRGYASSAVEVRHLAVGEAVAGEADAIGIIHVLEGAVAGAGTTDTLLFDGAFEVVATERSVLVAGRVKPRVRGADER